MRQVTDQDIYKMLLGNVVIGNMYNSPIPGRRDKTPSFSLYEKNGKILWSDKGLPTQFGPEPAHLYQHMRLFPITHAGYYQAKEAMLNEVKLGIIGKPPTQLRAKPKADHAPYLAGEEYLPFELQYWQRFEYTGSQLQYEDIYPLRKMAWNEGGQVIFESKPEDPAFVYWWNRNPLSCKIYRPLAQKRDKFRQWNVEGIIEGWKTLLIGYNTRNGKPFDIIFVSSSTKDRLVKKRAMGKECSAINPRGEGDFKDIVEKASVIKSMAKRVVCLYDADDAGYEGAKRMAELSGFEFYDTRNKLSGWKDFADMKDTTKGNLSYEFINQTITNLIS